MEEWEETTLFSSFLHFSRAAPFCKIASKEKTTTKLVSKGEILQPYYTTLHEPDLFWGQLCYGSVPWREKQG